MVLSELIDIVGQEDVSTAKVDQMTYAVDHYWIRNVVDRDGNPSCPTSSFTQRPLKGLPILQLATHIVYRYPLGRRIGISGGALPLYGALPLTSKS